MTQHVLGMPWLLGSFNYRPFQMDQGYLEITYSSVERQERSSASLDSNYCGIWVFVLRFSLFFFSFFFCSARICWLFHGEQCICALFTNPQIPLFSNFFIKNGSHGTIHTFKNYFVTVFSVLVFSFSKNKLNPNVSQIYNKTREKDNAKIVTDLYIKFSH